MRQITLRVYEDLQDDVEMVLEDHDLDYVAIRDDGDEDEDAGMMFLFPLPSQAVTDVFHDLENAGVSEEAYTVFSEASHVETPRFGEIQEEYSDKVRGLSRRELHSKVQKLTWPTLTYYVGTILSVVVATVGLLLDSPAIVIGSMVIAPQVSSALTVTAGVYHGDLEMFVGGARRQTVGLVAAVLGSAAFAWLMQWGSFVPGKVAVASLELMGIRLAPTFLSSIAALAAGAVGAFGYTTNQSMSLVGVMIAAAIVPAAAAGGIAIAWGSWLVAAGAILVLAVNVLAINVGAVVTLLFMGYQPVWFDQTDLRSSLSSQRTATLTVALLFAVAVVTAGALTGMHVGYERGVNKAVDETFEEPRYADLTLETVQSEYGGWAGGTPEVSVTVVRGSGDAYPALPATLERRIESRTGQDVRVSVQYAESRTENAQSLRPTAGRTVRGRLPAVTASAPAP